MASFLNLVELFSFNYYYYNRFDFCFWSFSPCCFSWICEMNGCFKQNVLKRGQDAGFIAFYVQFMRHKGLLVFSHSLAFLLDILVHIIMFNTKFAYRRAAAKYTTIWVKKKFIFDLIWCAISSFVNKNCETKLICVVFFSSLFFCLFVCVSWVHKCFCFRCPTPYDFVVR